jgi:hypothetical protein
VVARRVPLVVPVEPEPPPAAPTPRPLTAQPRGPHDQWDFLEPDAHAGLDFGSPPGRLAADGPPATMKKR